MNSEDRDKALARIDKNVGLLLVATARLEEREDACQKEFKYVWAVMIILLGMIGFLAKKHWDEPKGGKPIVGMPIPSIRFFAGHDSELRD